MIIVDDELVHGNLQELMLNVLSNQHIPFVHCSNASGDVEEYNPIFVHRIFYDDIIESELYWFILPIMCICFEKYNLKINKMLRARLFWQPASVKEENYLHDRKKHKDNYFSDHVNFIYYCNESTGGTFIYDIEENNNNLQKYVEHKKGRFAIFDGNFYHTGSKPVENSRLVLNVNVTLDKK